MGIQKKRCVSSASHVTWLSGKGDGPAPSEPGGGRKGIWPKFLPWASKNPTSEGTSKPLNKAVNNVKFGCYITITVKCGY